MKRLSKSRYQKGLQCEKALWLTVHNPSVADPITESQQWIFDQGSTVGQLAQSLFPGGVEVTEDHFQTAQALVRTQELIASGADVLYEPAFEFDNVLVRVDILVRVEPGVWDLYEVKSASSAKEQFVTDAAIQTYVVEGTGLRVRTSNVVHINNQYVHDGGEYDPAKLFAIADVTDEVRQHIVGVPDMLGYMQQMLTGPEPDIRIGSRCRKPYDCSFAGHCHAFLPADNPITNLPRLSEKACNALLDAGILAIDHIPSGFDGLSDNQASVVEVVRSGRPDINGEGLHKDLGALQWPVKHLDFETIMPALPLWAGVRPYEAVPFQYSIHIHEQDGSVSHREFLAPAGEDPRRTLAERMLEDLGESGSIIHYSPYERKILNALAEWFPEMQEQFDAVLGRMFDLEKMVRARLKHPLDCGRTSIKFVLPAWCPELTYSDLDVKDGQTASVKYLRMAMGLLDEQEARKLNQDLLDYCRLDTFATVRLLEESRRFADEWVSNRGPGA